LVEPVRELVAGDVDRLAGGVEFAECGHGGGAGFGYAGKGDYVRGEAAGDIVADGDAGVLGEQGAPVWVGEHLLSQHTQPS
jgi:hypothetical protein